MDYGEHAQRLGDRLPGTVMTAEIEPAAAQRRPLLFGSLAGYRRRWLRGDLIAGLTVWAVLVPESLAYASIAGVSPVVGLYAAAPALVLYAAFGSSRHLVTGPMAATAALSAAAVAGVASTSDADAATLTVVLALLVGIVALLAGLLRLGFVASFISEPVLKGFIVGLALTIIIGQVPKLLGVEGGKGEFFEKLWAVLGELGSIDPWTFAVGIVSLALVLGLRRWAPVVPGSLAAVAFGIGVVALFGLDERGVDIVGAIESGLPAIGLPDAALSDYAALAAASIGVMLVGFTEGLGAAKTYAARDHYEIDPNRELIGLGAANLGAGLASGMVVNGSLSKTAVNGSAGARGQVSGLVVAGLTVITLLFLTGLFADLPEATLAAIVIAALIELVDFESLARYYRVASRSWQAHLGPAARPDFVAALAAMFGVLIFDTLPGLFIGIGVSVVLLVYRSSRPHVAELGEVVGVSGTFADIERSAPTHRVDGVGIVRIEGPIYFSNAEYVRQHVRSVANRPGIVAVVIDGGTVSYVDVTAAQMLSELSSDLRRTGVMLAMAQEVGQVRDVLRLNNPDTPLEVYPSLHTAVAAVAPGGMPPSAGSPHPEN